jgi:uncharacterized damage-inducible protein DinB
MSDSGAANAFLNQAAFLLAEDFLSRLRRAVDQLTDDQIWWRPNENSNSVGNLILHLSGNVRQWIVAGVGAEPDHRKRALEFSEKGPISREELFNVLESAVAKAGQVLAEFDRSRVGDRKSIQAYEVSVIQAVIHVVEHFSYHLGQIVYVTKMLRDSDLKFYKGL